MKPCFPLLWSVAPALWPSPYTRWLSRLTSLPYLLFLPLVLSSCSSPPHPAFSTLWPGWPVSASHCLKIEVKPLESPFDLTLTALARVGDLNKTLVFLALLEAKSPRSRCRQGCFLPGLLSLACRCPLLPVSSRCLLCVSLCSTIVFL